MSFTTSASLSRITNFGIQCQLFIIKYLAIKEGYCNFQKHQTFHIWLFHLQLTYLIVGFFASYLSFLILIWYFYTILFTFLKSLSNKSHNMVRKNQDTKIKFLYFVQLVGAKKFVVLFV